VAGSLGAKAVEMATLVVLATVVPRVLGPSDFGRFGVMLTVVTLGSLALTLGGATVMVRFVPAAPEHERVAVARAIGARLARGRCAQLALLGAVACAAALVFRSHFPPVDTAMVFAALALNVATSLGLQTTLGLGRTGAWSARWPLQNAVLIAAVIVLYGRFGMTGATVAILLSAVAGALLATVSVVPVLATNHASAPVPPGAIRFGVIQAGAAALVQFAQRGGVLAVALLAGSRVQTGYAALAVGIALGATYAVMQTFTVSVPHLDHRHAPLDGSHAGESALRRLAGLMLAVIVPVAALAAALAPHVVPRVFGTDYRGATASFGPALALVVLAPLAALLVQASVLRLRPDVAFRAGLATAGAFLVVAFVAVPGAGAEGAMVATLLGTALGAALAAHALPGAAGSRLVVSSYVSALLVLGVSYLV
jgi:O-antigen/teichoic acid export membrane protein